MTRHEIGKDIEGVAIDKSAVNIIRNTVVITAFFVFFSAVVAFAEISVKAEVDKLRLTTDEVLTYKLTVSSSDKNLGQPKIPKFKGFTVVSQVQSSNIAFVEGGIETVIEYLFILAPADIGKFTIEPSRIMIMNKTFSSEDFQIQVIQGKTPKSQEPSYPEEHPLETETPQIIL